MRRFYKILTKDEKEYKTAGKELAKSIALTLLPAAGAKLSQMALASEVMKDSAVLKSFLESLPSLPVQPTCLFQCQSARLRMRENARHLLYLHFIGIKFAFPSSAADTSRKPGGHESICLVVCKSRRDVWSGPGSQTLVRNFVH